MLLLSFIVDPNISQHIAAKFMENLLDLTTVVTTHKYIAKGFEYVVKLNYTTEVRWKLSKSS